MTQQRKPTKRVYKAWAGIVGNEIGEFADDCPGKPMMLCIYKTRLDVDRDYGAHYGKVVPITITIGGRK